MYYSIAEFIEDAEQKGKSLSDLMIEQEMAQNQVSFDEVGMPWIIISKPWRKQLKTQ